MKIRLDQIVDEPFDWQEKVSLSKGEFDHPDVCQLGDLSCRGHVAVIGSDHLLQGSVSYSQTLRCTRCLENFDVAVEAEVALIVRVGGPEAGSAESTERELEKEELGFLKVQEPELDTRPLWLEQLQLGVPMKPLCKAECAGLCGQCGADLNAGACDCGLKTDPRWAALAGLGTPTKPAGEH